LSLYEFYSATIHYKLISDRSGKEAPPPSEDFDERYAAMLEAVRKMKDPSVKVH